MKKIALFVCAAVLLFGATALQTKAYYGDMYGYNNSQYGYDCGCDGSYSNNYYGSSYTNQSGNGYSNGNNYYGASNYGYGYGQNQNYGYGNNNYNYQPSCGYGCGNNNGWNNYNNNYYQPVVSTPPSFYYQTVMYPWQYQQYQYQQAPTCSWYTHC